MNKNSSQFYSLKNIERLLGVDRIALRKVAYRAGAYYDPYDEMQKKPNGKTKLRHIDNPNEELKYIQRKILKKILLKQMLLLPAGIIGGVAGKSIRDNAQPHLNQEMIITIDIKNCFPNTTVYMIFKVWKNTVGCGTKLAKLLTKLTTFRTILPQGAPTSNALCNLALLPLFKDIKTYADENEIAFTLYVDDITISGKTSDVLPAISAIIKKVQKNGFGVRREKIGIMPANNQQRVTGLNTNKKLNVSQRKIEEVRRQIIAIARRNNGVTRSEHNSIKGSIQYVKTVSKDKAEKLNRFAEMFLPKTFIEKEEEIERRIIRKCRHHKRA